MKTRAPRTSSLLGLASNGLSPFPLTFSPFAACYCCLLSATSCLSSFSLPFLASSRSVPPPSASRHLSSPALPFPHLLGPSIYFQPPPLASVSRVYYLSCPPRRSRLHWLPFSLAACVYPLYASSSPSLFSLVSPCGLAQPAAQLPLVLHLLCFFSMLACSKERQLSHATIPHPTPPSPLCVFPPAAYRLPFSPVPSHACYLTHNYYCSPKPLCYSPLFAVHLQIPSSRDKPDTLAALNSTQPPRPRSQAPPVWPFLSSITLLPLCLML